MSDKPDSTPDAAANDRATPTGTSRDEVSIRRAPKLSMFLLVGGALGAIATLILTAMFEVDPKVGFGALFGYFALYGVPFGVLVGALVALILDRRSRRKATTVTMEHESVHEPAREHGPELQLEPESEPELRLEPEQRPASQPQSQSGAEVEPGDPTSTPER